MATMTGERETSFCNKTQTDALARALHRQKQEWLFCDVLIKVCGREISAHSNVLAAVSPYFATFFSHEVPRSFSQKSPQIIEIRIDGCHESNSIYEAAVDAIIDYIYTGEIRVGGSSVAQITEIAKTMQLDDVVLFCEDVINAKVTNSQVLKFGKVASDTSLGATSEGPTAVQEVVVRGNEIKPIHLLLSNLPVAHPGSSCGSTTRARSVKRNSIATQVRPSLLGIQSSPAEMKDQGTSTDKRIFWNFVRCREPSAAKTKASWTICDDDNMEATPAESEQASTLIAVGVVDYDESDQRTDQNLSVVKSEISVDSTHTSTRNNHERQNTSPVTDQSDKDHTEVFVRHSSRVRRKPLKLLEAGETYVEPPSSGIEESAEKDIHDIKPSPDKLELTHDSRLQDIDEIQSAVNTTSESNEATANSIELILTSAPVEVTRALDSVYSEDPQTAAKFSRSKTKKRPSSLLGGETSSDWKKFRCDSCAFGTNNVRSMSAHNKLHKISDNICYYCELKFDGKRSLELHMSEHTNQTMPFFCRFCQQHFQSRTQLMLHLPKHSDEKPYICEVCSVGFKWKNALKNHMITHENKKEHLCDICGYATAHRCQLKAHRLVHTGETIKCPQEGCNYHATKTQNLKYHMLTHTQEKAHQCEVCGTSFSLVKNLKRHMLLHTSQRTHKCDLCDFASTRFDKLKEHLHKQHSIGTAPERRLRITDMVYQNRIVDNTGPHGSANSKPSAATGYEQLTDVGDMKSDLEVFYSGDYQMLELPDGVHVDDVKDLRFLSNQTTIILTNADNIGSLAAVQSHLANVAVASVSPAESEEQIYNDGEPASGGVDDDYIEDDDENQSSDYVC